MKKSMRKAILFGGLALALGGVGVGAGMLLQKGESELDAAQRELRTYYVEGSAQSTMTYGTKSYEEWDGVCVDGVQVSLKSGDKAVLRGVIDLKEKAANDALLRLVIAPEMAGNMEMECLKIDLVDVYDSQNFVTVQLKPYRGQGINATAAYYLASANNGQLPTGKNRSGANIYVNEWGSFINCNFGANFGVYKENVDDNPDNDIGFGDQVVSVGFDYKNNAVYSVENGVERMIADFDDSEYFPGNAWKGFTTGEIYCRVYCEEYSAGMANFVVTEYNDYDLTQEYVTDEKAPALSVQYAGYTQENLPVAVVGKEYKLFNAEAYDLYSGKCDVNVQVYTNYYSSNKKTVPTSTRLGTFIPTTETQYYAEYSTADSQGHKTIEVVQINAVKQTAALDVAFGEYAETCVIGDNYELPAFTLSGGSGKSSAEILVKIGEQTLPIDRGSVRVTKTGTLTVSVTATDYVGQSVTESVEVNVVATDKPTFTQLPVLPKYFVAGNRYDLPNVTAYNYIDESGSPVTTTLEVKGKNGENVGVLTGNRFVPAAETEGLVAVVSYKASVGGAETTESKEIPVIKTRFMETMLDEDNNPVLDANNQEVKQSVVRMAKYFVGTSGASVAPTAESMELNATKDASVEFVNALYSNALTLEFLTNDKSESMGKVSVILTDYYDAGNQIKFTYENAATGVYVYLNDDAANRVLSTMNFQSGTRYNFVYDNVTQAMRYDTATDKTLTAVTNLAGEKFDGFSGNKFYLSVAFEGVEGAAGISLRYINSHFFNNAKMDRGVPNIVINGDYGGDLKLNTKLVLPEVLVSDVLDGDVDAYVSVSNPDGDTVTSVEGVALKNALVTGAPITLHLTEFGMYLVEYTATDNSGRKETRKYTLRVVDDTKPVITLSGEPITQAKVGDKVEVPKASVTDDKDTNLNVEVYIIKPNLEMYTFELDKYSTFTATVAGDYTIIYNATDAEGNLSVIVRVIKVKEA